MPKNGQRHFLNETGAKGAQGGRQSRRERKKGSGRTVKAEREAVRRKILEDQEPSLEMEGLGKGVKRERKRGRSPGETKRNSFRNSERGQGLMRIQFSADIVKTEFYAPVEGVNIGNPRTNPNCSAGRGPMPPIEKEKAQGKKSRRIATLREGASNPLKEQEQGKRSR